MKRGQKPKKTMPQPATHLPSQPSLRVPRLAKKLAQPTVMVPGESSFRFGAQLRAGLQLGDCVLDRELESGNRGVLWVARQDGLNRQVAIKVLRRDLVTPMIQKDFQERAEELAQLDHISLAQVYSLGRQKHVQFLVQEYMPGLRMSALLKAVPRDAEGKPLPGSLPCIKNTLRKSLGLAPTPSRWVFAEDRSSLGCAVRHIAEIAEGLEHAHRKNIAHGAVCEENILIHESGSAKLFDFSMRDGLTIRRKRIMKGYLAPEQIRKGRRSCSADVFSLGVVLYRLLTLQFPYDADGRMLGRQQVIRRMRKYSPRVPRALARLVAKAIQPDARLRYQRAGDFSDDLRRFLKSYNHRRLFLSLQFLETGRDFVQALLKDIFRGGKGNAERLLVSESSASNESDVVLVE